MKPGKGKEKGGEFERVVCKALSLWVSDGERIDIFWRAAMSGGRSTIQLKKGERASAQAGDISAVDPLGAALISEFVIECKAYKDLKLHTLWTGKRVQESIVDFWLQAVKNASKYHKKPMLVARQNLLPVFLCLNDKGMWQFESLMPYLAPNSLVHPQAIIPQFDMNIFLFDKFLEEVPPLK